MQSINKQVSKQAKCVYAVYHVTEKFKIPKGIDLENKEQVTSWLIKYNIMTIYLANGKEIKIEPTYNVPHHYDWKWSHSEEIEDDEEDDDEEEEEEGQYCRRCQTFVPDGKECVLEGDCDAYCETCFKQVEEKQDNEED